MTFHWVGMKIFWNPTLSEENKTATVAWWITTCWSNKLKLHLLVRRKSTDFILIFFLYIDSYWTSVCPRVHCGKHGRLYHFSQVLSLKNEIRHYWFLDNVLIWLWQKKIMISLESWFVVRWVCLVLLQVFISTVMKDFEMVGVAF